MLVVALVISMQSPAPVFLPPFPVLVAGKEISVENGHAAPAHYDFDGDGRKDLLVGQFEGGVLNLYRNFGSNELPAFTKGVVVKSGNAPIAVEFG